MPIPSKPKLTPDIEAKLLGEAKAEKPKGLNGNGQAAAVGDGQGAAAPVAGGPAPAGDPKPPKQPMAGKAMADITALLGEKQKTFPIDMPPQLHKAAEACAKASVPRKPLHDYILEAIAEKVIRDTQGTK